MFRSICGGLALAVCSLSVLSGAPRQQDDQSALPMRFATYQEGPDGCGATCRTLISASGMITADTPRDFDTFARGRDLRGATIVLDSKGGSVLGAITLGRAIRGLGLATTVGRIREQSGREGLAKRASIWPRAECQSMCPFVLLGGLRRWIPPEARVLVHQIWLGDRRDDAAAANYTAEDLVLVQRDIGKLVQYTLDMGGGAELLEVALRIPPWEPMRMLSRDELRRTRLDTSQDRATGQTQTPAAPTSSGVDSPTVATPASDGAHSEIANPRGWMMAERAGGAALVRQHPLTVEGDKIGTFEVALGCGPSAGTYAVTYAETRRSSDGRDAGDAAAVKQVDLWIEGKTATLDLVSSRINTMPRELETLASGTVSTALVKSFAEAASDSITVRTVSGATPGTLIRVGNTGFAGAYPRLTAACDGQLAARVETHAELTPPRGGGDHAQ
jgi:hypothetical protein